ncbi:MAG TPA: hypothetical protein VNM92_01575 [Thermoanaerobaculia bacterium]|nr:hypothetical protein [Thermoanaerobaculia bacterium]
MKKLAVAMVFVMSTGVAFAGGEHCKVKKASMKNVELTGKLVCSDGSTARDCTRVFRVANSENTQFKVCDKSKARLTALGKDGNSTVRVSGKLVNCGEGEELMIDKVSKT